MPLHQVRYSSMISMLFAVKNLESAISTERSLLQKLYLNALRNTSLSMENHELKGHCFVLVSGYVC